MINVFKILFLLTCLNPVVYSLPVLSSNSAENLYAVIHPDHKNPNKFYIAPRKIGIAYDEDGVPLISYTEISKTLATLDIVLTGDIKEIQETAQKFKAIRKKKGLKTNISLIPVIDSKLESFPDIPSSFYKAKCQEKAAQLSANSACSFQLYRKAIKHFRKKLRASHTVTVSYTYTVAGLIEGENGKLEKHIQKRGVAGSIGGKSLDKYPYLFTDHKGNPILE